MRSFTLATAALGLSAGAAAQGLTNPATVLISEVRIDQTSADNDEYFELFVVPSGATLDGLTYLVIGDGTGGSGVIESVTDLTGSVAGANGYFVAAETTFTAGTADLIADLNFENSDNVTHLVVSGFTGASGDDLDTDDDGNLDVTPWTQVWDAVSLIESIDSTGTELYYAQTLGGNVVGPDGTFVPGHAFRCLTTLTDWRIGLFDPVGLSDTPGADNPCTGARTEFCAPAAGNSFSPAGGTCTLIGSGSIQLNDSFLLAESVTNGFGLFGYSMVSQAPMTSPIGGNICITDPVVRLNVILPITANEASLQLDFADPAKFEFGTPVGQTAYYQFFFRDQSTGLGGNYTTGVAVTWAP